MEGESNGSNVRENFMERTRALSPIPLARSPDNQLHSSPPTITSSSGMGPDEGIPLDSDRGDVSRIMKCKDSSGDSSTICNSEEREDKSTQKSDWYSQKLEEKVQNLTQELEELKSKKDGSNANQSEFIPELSTSINSSGQKRKRTEGENAAINRAETLRRELEAVHLIETRLRDKHEYDLSEKDAEIANLKRRLALTMNQEDTSQEQIRRLRFDCIELRRAQETNRIEYENELRQKDEEIEEMNSQMLKMEENYTRSSSDDRLTIENLRMELAAKSDPHSSDIASVVRESEMRLLQEKLDEKTIEAQNAVLTLGDAEETIKMAREVEILRQKLAEMKSIESKYNEEIRKLRLAAKSTATLEEKISSLYRSLDAKERQLQDAIAIQSSYAQLVEEKKEWQQFFEPLFNDPNKGISPQLAKDAPTKALCQVFSSLQNDVETLREERFTMENRVKKLVADIVAAEQKQLDMVSRQSALEMTISSLESKLNESTKSESRLRESNADLLLLVKSYTENGGVDPSSGLFQKLEAAWSKAEETIVLLQNDKKNAHSSAEIASYTKRIHSLEQLLHVQKSECIALKEKLEQSQSSLGLVEKRLQQGPVNQDSMKVVRLITGMESSPAQEKIESKEMKELRQENERLKEIVQSQNSETPGLKGSMTTPLKSINTNQDTLEGLQKMNQRLKEVFRGQITKYRDAVYQATGYKIDLKYPELRLRSLYAENEDDDIKFQFNQGELELLETPFVNGLDQRSMAYLTMCNSIPAFLSGITLSLFEKQTYQG